jgi:phosphatidate phosphatase APP1
VVFVPVLTRAGDVPALLLPPALGRTDRAWIFGRVLEETYGESGPQPFRTTRTLAGRNKPGAEVEVRLLGVSARTVSGHDGEFEVELRAPEGAPFPPGRHEAEVRVLDARHPEREVVAAAAVEIVAPGAPFLLVSDFDDTVAISNVTSTRRLLATTFLETAETQPAVPGMANLYRCLVARGAPLAVVSGSPVQFAPRLGRFLEKNAFPPAALFLRNLGRTTLRGGYKEPVLAQLAARFPDLPFVLVGDSGEKDPEIFHAFVRGNPGRVLRAYVRKATPTPGATARFEGLVLFADPADALADARAHGLAADACDAAPAPVPGAAP